MCKVFNILEQHVLSPQNGIQESQCKTALCSLFITLCYNSINTLHSVPWCSFITCWELVGSCLVTTGKQQAPAGPSHSSLLKNLLIFLDKQGWLLQSSKSLELRKSRDAGHREIFLPFSGSYSFSSLGEVGAAVLTIVVYKGSNTDFIRRHAEKMSGTICSFLA